jgi:hypothetical protein
LGLCAKLLTAVQMNENRRLPLEDEQHSFQTMVYNTAGKP